MRMERYGNLSLMILEESGPDNLRSSMGSCPPVSIRSHPRTPGVLPRWPLDEPITSPLPGQEACIAWCSHFRSTQSKRFVADLSCASHRPSLRRHDFVISASSPVE